MKYRYSILCFFILILMIFQTVNVQWSGDFWAHSAAIRELTANPFSPQHPHVLSNDSSVLYTPYILFLAFASRVMHLNPVTTLSIAGIVNLLLFFYGLKLFTTLLSSKKSSAIAFYALLFTMLLWGKDAWMKSGYLYLSLLGEALPLPATFAFAISLIALSIHILIVRGSNRLWYIPLSIISVVVIISNPQTFMFLSIGLVSISLGTKKLPLADYALLVCVFIALFLAALSWPYYDFSFLLPFKTNMYQQIGSSRNAYVAILMRTFPALIGIPFVIYRLKSNLRDPLVLLLFFLCLIYTYGGLTANYGYGRAISYILFTLQVTAAFGVAAIESKLGEGYKYTDSKYNLKYIIFNAVLLIFLGFFIWESKRLVATHMATTLLLKSIMFLIAFIVSVVLTSLLFRSPGWFWHLPSLKQKSVFSSFIVIFACIISFNDQILPTLKNSLISKQNTSSYYLPNSHFEFLSKFTKRSDVILSDMKTSWIVPTFGGKIIAPLHPPCCVADYNRRVWDIKYFFGNTTVHKKSIRKEFGTEKEFGPIPDNPSYKYQLEIIRKYNADFLLINKLLISSWQKMAESFSPLGRIVLNNDDFVLIAFDSANKTKSISQNLMQN